MKHLTWVLISTCLLLSCKEDTPSDDDDGGTDTEAAIQLGLLTGKTWVPGTITKDDVALAEEYPYFADFTLTFSGSLNADETNVTNGTYTTSDPGEVLPSGSWEFSSDVETQLELNDPANGPTPVTYSVTESSLQLTFTRGNPGGRTEGITGNYVFDLIPQ